MTTFLFSYRMPENHTPGRPDAAAAWTAWFQDMGASVTDPGNPVFESVSLGTTAPTPGSAGTRSSPPTTLTQRSPLRRAARLCRAGAASKSA